jgi:HSP20 family protein
MVMMERDTTGWMWQEACAMLDEAERMHRQFYRVGQVQLQTVWEPPTDIFETQEELWIVVALPGAKLEETRVVIDGGVLTVVSERRLPAAMRQAVIRRMELPYGRLQKSVQLPPGRFEIHTRDLIDGCLHLGLHKLDDAR